MPFYLYFCDPVPTVNDVFKERKKIKVLLCELMPEFIGSAVNLKIRLVDSFLYTSARNCVLDGFKTTAPLLWCIL